MSKIAKYLNEHILGEITGAKAVRERFSRDRSVLTIKPELVMFPRVTNDIRKAARFSWQLAEKGHVLPLTIRGAGSDETGAAIGKGLIINTTAHLNRNIYRFKGQGSLCSCSTWRHVQGLKRCPQLAWTGCAYLSKFCCL
jgi:FAD/FMN-containing dehydrogenase